MLIPPVVAIVPAAGSATRFGSPKLLAMFDGARLLDRTLATLLDAGIDRVVVVVASGAVLDEARLIHDVRVTKVINHNPSRGMFSSIQAGLPEAAGHSIVIAPADMPFVASETVRVLLSAAAGEDRIVVPVYEGRRGHPVVIPSRYGAVLEDADPHLSLKDVLARAGAEFVAIPVNDSGVLRDVDTPGDLWPGGGT